jgi:hypothetical protein
VLIGGVVVTRGGLQILASLLGDHDRKFANVSDIFLYSKIKYDFKTQVKNQRAIDVLKGVI